MKELILMEPTTKTPQETGALHTRIGAGERTRAHGFTAGRQAKPIALYSVHGMGEQVRFQEIDKIAKVFREEGGRHGYKPPKTTSAIVELNGNAYPRTDLLIEREDGTEVELHIYEAYWASVTEGQVTLKDTIDFFSQAGWDGFKEARGGVYKRWMYDHWQDYKLLPTLRPWFLFMIAIVAALVAVNSALTLLLARSQLADSADDILASVARLLLFVLIVAAATGLSFALDSRIDKKELDAYHKSDAAHPYVPSRTKTEAHRPFGTTRSSALLLATFFSLIVAAIPISVMTASPAWSRIHLTGLIMKPDGFWFSKAWPWAILGVTTYLSKQVRDWLVGYVGDLAVYLSANRASKFDKLRDEIQKRACGVLTDIYKAAVNGEAAYDDVIVISHSLGTVIAYDAFGGVIRAEALFPDSFPKGSTVAERTRLLLTCGSPLDTTAFLFRSQLSGDPYVRETLSTAMQPLIIDSVYRPRRWVNVWTNMDPIGSALSFYNPLQPPNAPGVRVEDIVDLLGTIPFVSHSDYFDHPALRDVLVRTALA